MKKTALLAIVMFAAGLGGAVMALDFLPSPAQASTGVIHRVVKKMEGHFRVWKLRDRIKSQRERITQGLSNGTLTADQAASCRAAVDSVVAKMKAEARAHGPKRPLSKDQYDAYNTALDANSAAIREEKQDFYYYGAYYDWGPDYAYTYDPYAGSSAQALSHKQETHPRIFGLKERIRNQRERIKQGLADGTLTPDQAKAERGVLSAVVGKMKADHKANGSKTMTRDQYQAYNTALDANSSLLREQKHSFYYYSPYYDHYTYWF